MTIDARCRPSAPIARCLRSAALLAEARVGVGLHLGAPSPTWTAAVFSTVEGCGAARWVLRKL